MLLNLTIPRRLANFYPRAKQLSCFRTQVRNIHCFFNYTLSSYTQWEYPISIKVILFASNPLRMATHTRDMLFRAFVLRASFVYCTSARITATEDEYRDTSLRL